MSIKTAIYVRVSTDTDAQRDSPQHQIATCTDYALAHGFAVNERRVYNDAGVSGTEMANRPEVQRLLEDARHGDFDTVLFTAISRFSRDLSDVFQMKKSLETVYGIRLISIEEGYDSAVIGRNNEMVFTVHAMLAAHKSKEMSVAIQRGLKQSARRGRHTGNMPPFGYSKSSDKKLRIDPRSAYVVRDIFDFYLAGFGSAEIATRLNGRNIPTSMQLHRNRQTSWQASTVNAILHNLVYIGTIVAHRWVVAQDVQSSRAANTPMKKAIVRDELEWVVVEGAHEPIVEAQKFHRVQAMLRQKAGRRTDRRNTNELAGLLVCDCCGGAMVVTSSGHRKSTGVALYRYVVCGKTRRIGKTACENHQRTRYEELLHGLMNHLSNLFWRYQRATETHDDVQRILRTNTDIVSTRLEELRQLIQRTDHEQLENLRAFQTGLFSIEVIQLGQAELAHRAEQLRGEMEILTRKLQQTRSVTGDMPALRLSLNLFDHVGDDENRALRAAFRLLIEKVIFKNNGEIHVCFRFRTPTSTDTCLHE